MLIRQLFSWLISLLPNYSPSPNVFNAFLKVKQVSGAVNAYIPVDTFCSCLVVLFPSLIAIVVLGAILKLL